MNKLVIAAYFLVCSVPIGDIALDSVRAQTAAGAIQPVVRTHALEVVNQAGKTEAAMFAVHGSVAVLMLGSKGEGNFGVGASNEAVGLGIDNSLGQRDIVMGSGDETTQPPYIAVYKDDQQSASINSDLDGGSGFNVYDENQVNRATVGYQFTGEDEAAIFDKSNTDRAGMEYDDGDNSSSIWGTDGNKQAEITCDKGSSSISADDAKVRRAMLIRLADPDISRLTIDDKSKRCIWSAPVFPPDALVSPTP